MTMSKKLRIGITLGLREEGESLWINGIKQNAIFLSMALQNCRSVGEVTLVNVTDVNPATVAWDLSRWPVARFDDIRDDLDVLIELGGQVSAAQTEHLKSRGTRLVSYCCGSEYVSVLQSILFDRGNWSQGIFINPRYDAVWVIPQVVQTSGHFFRSFRRCPTHVVPFVWHPVFLQERSTEYPEGGVYLPRQGPRRLSVVEPNTDLVKFCLYPILIAEEAFRQRPELISFLHVTNSKHLADKGGLFVNLMLQLDIVQANKASFIQRQDTPDMLANLTDVVISNQWGNPLNYMYLEVCWQGYPLVHNAELCKTLGYYYKGNDVVSGAQLLIKAMVEHDGQFESYRKAQRAAIAAYLPSSLAVAEKYEQLLASALAGSLR
jgi:hypothetical protein